LRSSLFVLLLGKLVLRDRSPDAELGDGCSLSTRRRLSLDRVDQRRRKGLVIGIGPLRLRYNLLDIFTEEDEIVLDVLFANYSLTIHDCFLWLLRFFSSFFLTFRLFSNSVSLSFFAFFVLAINVNSLGLLSLIRLSHNDRGEELLQLLLFQGPFRLVFRSVILGLVGSSSSLFCLLASNFGFLKLALFFSFSSSFFFGFNLGGVFLLLLTRLALAGLDLVGALSERGLLSGTNVTLFFLVFGDVSWVMSTSVPIVCADFSLVNISSVVSRVVLVLKRLLIEVENDDFDLLLRNGVTD